MPVSSEGAGDKRNENTLEAAGGFGGDGIFSLLNEKAGKANIPVFVEFIGYFDTNCCAMETNIFSLESIQKRFAKMQQVRLYTGDGTEGPKNQKIQY